MDDGDDDWLDGFLTGFIMFDNSKGPFGFIVLIAVIIFVCLYYYYG